MISYNKSKIILKKSVIKLGEEFININKCLNRVTSKNIYAKNPSVHPHQVHFEFLAEFLTL